MEEDKGINELSKVIAHLHANVFPNLSDAELLNFMLALKGWVEDKFSGDSDPIRSTYKKI